MYGTRSETCAGLAEIPISSIATGREPVLFSTSDSDSLLVRPPSAREVREEPHQWLPSLPRLPTDRTGCWPVARPEPRRPQGQAAARGGGSLRINQKGHQLH